MKSKQAIKEWILENCIDEDGDINLTGLDFSDFEGNVYLSGMQVKNDLHINAFLIGGDLWQTYLSVGGKVYGKVFKDKEVH